MVSGADGMNDVVGGQVGSPRNPRFTGGAANAVDGGHAATGCQQARPSRSVDSTVNASATEQKRVRGVDNDIGFSGGDITTEQLYMRVSHEFFDEQKTWRALQFIIRIRPLFMTRENPYHDQ